MPVALCHYGDSSDYKDWSGLLPLHLIALGNTHTRLKALTERVTLGYNSHRPGGDER